MKDSLPVEVVLALRCEETGIVREVMRDVRPPSQASSFLSWLEASSREKGRAFIAEGWATGRAEEWELLVEPSNAVPLCFSAFREGDELLVLASETSSLLRKALRNMNEGIPARENAEPPGQSRRRAIHDDNLNNRLMELNNELANSQRLVAKQAQELQKLNEERNRLVGMAAHDIRNPLTVILNYAQLLREGELVEGEHELMLDEVESASRFALQIVEDLLDVSKIEAGTMQLVRERVNPAEEIRSHVQKLRPFSSRRGVEFRLNIREPVSELELDRRKFLQVLDNYVMNALRFSPEGGEIVIDLSERDHELLLSIDDQGPGVPVELRERMFEPFVRAEGQRESGTGLGLAIVRKIVLMHGGRVGIEDSVQGGARFFATFPLAANLVAKV